MLGAEIQINLVDPAFERGAQTHIVSVGEQFAFEISRRRKPLLALFPVRLNQSLGKIPCHFLMEPAAMQTLARVPFFKDVADLDFERSDRRCNWRRYAAGEIVVDHDDESSDVYFIISGEVRILIRTLAGTEIILGETSRGADQFFGEMAAIDGEKRSANVTALANSEVCIMPTSVFREVIFSSPTICERILRLLTGRVRELNARLTEHSIFALKHRLYSELLRMAHPRLGRPHQRAVTPRLYTMFWPRGLVAGASR